VASARDVSAVFNRNAGETGKKLNLRKATAGMTLVVEAEVADRAADAASNAATATAEDD